MVACRRPFGSAPNASDGAASTLRAGSTACPRPRRLTVRFEHEAGQRGALLKWYVSDTLADIDNDRLALAHVVLVDATRDVVLAELPDCQESCGDSRVG